MGVRKTVRAQHAAFPYAARGMIRAALYEVGMALKRIAEPSIPGAEPPLIVARRCRSLCPTCAAVIDRHFDLSGLRDSLREFLARVPE